MAARRANESPALETNTSNQNHSRRRNKVLGFIIAETVAFAVLFLAGAFVLSAPPVNSTVITTLNVVMLTAAAGVATIPIFFFALAPILPRSRR
jgi:heme/copper-type cytochrome/quinol oxidase subunit 3